MIECRTQTFIYLFVLGDAFPPDFKDTLPFIQD